MIILVGGEKGGTGKTTIATNIAAMRARQDREVLLVDTDTQGSASQWANARPTDANHKPITCISKFGKAVTKDIQMLAPRFNDIVIDSGGRDSIELRASLLVAEIMLIPARPSQFDIHGLAAIDRIVDEARTYNPNLLAYVVVNCAPTHATNTDADDMREVVSDLEHVGLCDSILRDRVSYRRAARDGVSVVEYVPKDERATAEMQALYDELLEKAGHE